MKILLKSILFVFLLIAFSYPATGEVVKISVDTNSSWKCLDAEDPGWTDVDYDDSWWEPVMVLPSYMGQIANSWSIWYPGEVNPKAVYFRKDFELENLDIISAKLYFGVKHNSYGYTDLYVNNQSIGKFNNTYDYPSEVNITSYLETGKNVIAVKVVVQQIHQWALSGTVRYRRIASISTEEKGPSRQAANSPGSGLAKSLIKAEPSLNDSMNESMNETTGSPGRGFAESINESETAAESLPQE
jgi:hypothetical protein